MINSIYSDFDPVLKKHNANSIDAYVGLAKAWLKDKDAVENKAMAYWEYVVKK